MKPYPDFSLKRAYGTTCWPHLAAPQNCTGDSPYLNLVQILDQFVLPHLREDMQMVVG